MNKISFCQFSRTYTQSRIKSYYKVLSVRPHATPEEIKTAFYQKSKELHPDSNKSTGDATEFNELCIAYEILKNRRTRHKHDNLLGLHQDKRSHIDHNAPKAWTYANEDDAESVSNKEKVSLIMFFISVCTIAVLIIKFEISRREKITTYQKRTDGYMQVPPVLKQNPAPDKTPDIDKVGSTESSEPNLSADYLETLKTWR